MGKKQNVPFRSCLGYIISEQGLQQPPNKALAIDKVAMLTHVPELKCF